MTTFKQMGLGLALVQVLTACGDAGPDELIDSVEQVGEVSQSLNETALDRPLVAATMRYVGGEQQIWVFACDQNNKMRRLVKAGGVWANWITVNSSLSCGSPPSVGLWYRQSNEPTETIGVYWRDLSNQLIEARYNADGTTVTTNLSQATGFGPIVGSPVVVDATNRPGYTERFSVAVVKAGGSSELYTLDYYWSEWHTRPVLLTTGGATATVVPDTSIVASHTQGSLDPMLSIQANAGAHFIFKRHFWSNSYTQHAWTASSPTGSPKGAISFLRGASGACQSDLCALIRSTSNRPMLADVIAGGNITNQFYAPSGAQPGEPQLGASIRESAVWSFTGATVLANGNLGLFGFGRVEDQGFTNVSSAPTLLEPASNALFFTVGSQRSLHYWNFDSLPYDLGLDLAP